MRKKQREVTDPVELKAILDACDVCRIGLSDDGQPYLVPVNFGYSWTDQGLTLYFHGASEGRKLDIIRRNSRACFEVDRTLALIAGERACQYSMHYESIIGEGTIRILTDPEDKKSALNHLMHHYSGRKDWHFDPVVLEKTTVLCLTAVRFTGKRLLQ